VRDLTARLVRAKTTETVFSLAAETLAAFAFDMPFALLYQLGQQGPASRCYKLAACVGLPGDTAASPGLLALDAAAPWPVRSLIRSQTPQMVEGLEVSPDHRVFRHLTHQSCPPRWLLLSSGDEKQAR
jgi:hypothetical protein